MRLRERIIFLFIYLLLFSQNKIIREFIFSHSHEVTGSDAQLTSTHTDNFFCGYSAEIIGITGIPPIYEKFIGLRAPMNPSDFVDHIFIPAPIECGTI